MNFFQAIFLGLVQALTEYLPVSSSAHIRIVVYHQNMCHSLATISISHCIHKYKSHESPYKT